jgi:DNA-binding NarL/FixJ family response regulator
MSQTYKFLVVDDHPMIRDSMADALASKFVGSTIKKVDSAESALEFLTPFARQGKESSWWVLMDLGLPGISGLAAIRLLLALGSVIKLITVSGNDDELQVGACLGAGVVAFISKGARIEDTIELIFGVTSGVIKSGAWLSANGIADTREIKKIQLTERQMQVLSMMCQGKTNREISSALGITEITAKSHVGGIFKELHVINRTQAVLVAQRLGITSNNI